MNHPFGLNDAEVVHQRTVGLHGLGPHARACGPHIVGTDGGHELSEGGDEVLPAEASPQLQEAHPPVSSGHAPESGIGKDLEGVPRREAQPPVALALESQGRVGTGLSV